MTWKVHVENLLRFGQAGYKLYAMRGRHDGSYEVLYNPTIHSIVAGHTFDMSECLLNDEFPGLDVASFLQAMSDAAWDIGIKPKQLEDTLNELKATKLHLEDMRQLAGVKK